MTKKDEKAVEETEEKKTIILVGNDEKPEDEFRTIGVFGEIDEEKCAELIYSLLIHQLVDI